MKPLIICLYKFNNFFVARMLTPATLSDLDGIDMMDLPVDLEEPEVILKQEDIKYVNRFCKITLLKLLT